MSWSVEEDVVVEILCVILFLACVGFGYGVVGLVLARRDEDAELERKRKNCTFNAVAFGIACLIGFWLDSVGLLLNGWVLAGCLIGGFLLDVPFGLYVEKCQNLNNVVLGFFKPFVFLGVVLISLGLEIILVHVFAGGVFSGIILCAIGALWFWCMRVAFGANEKEIQEKEVKKQRTEQLEETLRESLVAAGKVPDGVDWNELEPVLRELTKRKMEALSEEEKREAYEMFHKRYSC